MKILVQRSKQSSVEINNKIYNEITSGFVVFVSFTINDDESIVDKMVNKLLNLRIFSDEDGKMNYSLLDLNYEILSISQFTLYASIKGRRPSFEKALNYKEAKKLYNYFNDKVKEYNIKIVTGVFGEDMKVNIENDGPVTIMLDSNEI